ncbi:MAG TPA: dTMP kinase [Kofleriaceae bacterium]|nr:dTMP kinase [Kofleriaceae bacterium]
MFVVFEGIDGGGKTTLSNRVAERLRASGLVVEHVREGGKFASSVTQAMRELGRDARNLALTPRAELMLYLTREVQLVEEATRPALARADVVIADRFVYTAEVLARYGRGLAEHEVAPLVAAATDLRPELVVLVDVDPQVARARRRVAKLVAKDDRPPSRKGLAGTALQQRLRLGYRELAARDSDRWIIVDNTDADLDALAELLTTAVGHARTHGARAARTLIPSQDARRIDAATEPASAKAALLAWIDQRSVREPGLAAYFLDGVPGAEAASRRAALAERAPAVVAAGLRWLDDEAAWQLRHRLAELAPADVASSLAGPAGHHRDAPALLQALAPRAPHAVADALWGRDDAVAWQLRDALPRDAVMRSLGGVPGERGWTMRDAWLAERGGLAALESHVAAATIACNSLAGLDDERAWQWRKALREVAPVAAVESTLGLADERSWKWRRRFVTRAPKTVMKTIVGLDDPRAWELRDQVAAHCEEAIDSMLGLDVEPAWELRARALATWPATAIKSLGLLGATPRGRELIVAALSRHPSDIALWRQVTIRA